MEQLTEHEKIIDAYYTSVFMKKGRPGILVSVLVYPYYSTEIEHFLLRETTTLGVRKTKYSRTIMDRKFEQIYILGYKVDIKIAEFDDQTVKFTPEYEDLKYVAQQSGLPIREVSQLSITKFKQSYF